MSSQDRKKGFPAGVEVSRSCLDACEIFTPRIPINMYTLPRIHVSTCSGLKLIWINRSWALRGRSGERGVKGVARRDKNRDQRNMPSGEERPAFLSLSFSRMQRALWCNSRVAAVGASELKCIVVRRNGELISFLSCCLCVCRGDQLGDYADDDCTQLELYRSTCISNYSEPREPYFEQ